MLKREKTGGIFSCTIAELMEAVPEAEPVWAGSMWVLQPNFMRELLIKLKIAIGKILPNILNPNESIFTTIEAVRIRREQEQEEAQRREYIQQQIDRSLQAFQARDYNKVITLLDPLQNDLPASALQRLKLAKKYK